VSISSDFLFSLNFEAKARVSLGLGGNSLYFSCTFVYWSNLVCASVTWCNCDYVTDNNRKKKGQDSANANSGSQSDVDGDKTHVKKQSWSKRQKQQEKLRHQGTVTVFTWSSWWLNTAT